MKYLDVFTYPITIILNLKIIGYLRLKFCIRVVPYYAETWLCKIEKFVKQFCTIHYRGPDRILYLKIEDGKSRDTVPLNKCDYAHFHFLYT